jgi:hypothetical protein
LRGFNDPSSAAIAAVLVTATMAFAQSSPPTYRADPDMYKVILEDENFHVIAATWKKALVITTTRIQYPPSLMR